MDNKDLFTHKSTDYSLCRPSYPFVAVEWLREKVDGNTVLDIGAGTGIFTKVLLPYFTDVSAVEPNKEMRKEFSRILPFVSCSASSGEETGKAADSIDLITVAQAFHWLEEEKFKQEAQRILKKNGKVAIIWNTRIKTAFTEARDEVCRKYCPGFRTGHAGKRSAGEGDIFLRESCYFQNVEVKNFPNDFTMDKNVFEGIMRSFLCAASGGS
ncbi:MAG: class I SAM-dependent methyltransferase [Lentisphaeria bacterium]|nr:class I SAM-dependent methyltransferase [Lentisphaeria bacterium]